MKYIFKSNLNYFGVFPRFHSEFHHKSIGTCHWKQNQATDTKEWIVIGPQVAAEFWVLHVAGERLWVAEQENRWGWDSRQAGDFIYLFIFNMQKTFLKLSSFDFSEKLAFCAKQLFIIVKVWQILNFQTWAQGNGGEGRSRLYCSCFDTTEIICRSLMEQEDMGSLFAIKCQHLDILVCYCRYIPFSNAALLPCARDPPPLCQGGERGATTAAWPFPQTPFSTALRTSGGPGESWNNVGFLVFYVIFPLIGKYMLEYLHCFAVALSQCQHVCYVRKRACNGGKSWWKWDDLEGDM